MDKNYFIQLTNSLYKLTLLFPKKEPLRYKMRELADETLGNWVSNPKSVKEILKDLEVLDSFFDIAKSQNWVSPNELLEIQKEYSKIKEDLKQPSFEKRISPLKRKISEASPQKTEIPVVDRQQKILEILKEKGQAQVGEFKEIFPEVTKRTLRRDFEQLLNQGLIKRIGERNNTFYQLKPR